MGFVHVVLRLGDLIAFCTNKLRAFLSAYYTVFWLGVLVQFLTAFSTCIYSHISKHGTRSSILAQINNLAYTSSN
jgi:hypothetical protein